MEHIKANITGWKPSQISYPVVGTCTEWFNGDAGDWLRQNLDEFTKPSKQRGRRDAKKYTAHMVDLSVHIHIHALDEQSWPCKTEAICWVDTHLS